MAKSYESEASSLPNIIGNGTKIVGDIETNGDLRIDGTIEGNVNSKGKLVLGAAGSIKGSIRCANAEISGNFEGKADITELLSLRSTSNFKGEMNINKLSVEPGAVFNGTCNMNGGASNKKSAAEAPKKED